MLHCSFLRCFELASRSAVSCNATFATFWIGNNPNIIWIQVIIYFFSHMLICQPLLSRRRVSNCTYLCSRAIFRTIRLRGWGYNKQFSMGVGGGGGGGGGDRPNHPRTHPNTALCSSWELQVEWQTRIKHQDVTKGSALSC